MCKAKYLVAKRVNLTINFLSLKTIYTTPARIILEKTREFCKKLLVKTAPRLCRQGGNDHTLFLPS